VKIVDFIRNRYQGIIYLVSYPMWIGINGLFATIFFCFYYKHLPRSLISYLDIGFRFCKNRLNYDHAIKGFIVFFLLKLSLVLIVLLLNRTKLKPLPKMAINELLAAYLFFDLIFVLTSLAGLIPVQLSHPYNVLRELRYFSSEAYQPLVSNLLWMPEYSTSIFWSLILILFCKFRLKMPLQQFFKRGLLALFSMIILLGIGFTHFFFVRGYWPF